MESGCTYKRAGWLLFFSALLVPSSSSAHVKWFADFNYANYPLTIDEVTSPLFWVMAALSIGAIAGLALIEEKLEQIPMIRSFDSWLSSKQEYAMGVMRVGTAAALILVWQTGNLLAPELVSDYQWLVWLQLVVALLLAFKSAVPVAGAGIAILYLLAVGQFGFFHMLDYFLYLGVAYYLIAANARRAMIRRFALPALYASVGFCLIWLGIEKLIFPSWSKLLLAEHPVLALGLDHDFFLVAAAFVEISLGFIVMLCMQQRIMALLLSLVFILSTLVFGRAEVVGHTLIHSVLIVFVIAGAGEVTSPLRFFYKTKWRVLVAVGAFSIIVGVLIAGYQMGATAIHLKAKEAIDQARNEKLVEVEDYAKPPKLVLRIHKDPVAGWNLELATENFTFAPQAAGSDPIPGEGHAHLYIDGKKVARLYSHWYHIPGLEQGRHEVVVTLNANNHAGWAVRGKEIRERLEVKVEPEDKEGQ